MAIRGILFDKDGTLLDYHKTWMPVNRAVASRVAGGDPVLTETLLTSGGYDPVRDRMVSGTLLAAGNNFQIAEHWHSMVREQWPDFDELLDWVQSGAVDHLGVFTYSDLPELQSHTLLEHVDQGVMAQRQDLLMQAQYDVALARNQRLLDTQIEVLLEDVLIDDEPELAEPTSAERGYRYAGRSWRDAYEIDGQVRVHSSNLLELYTRVSARVTAADAYDLDATTN